MANSTAVLQRRAWWVPLLFVVLGTLVYWKSFGASFRFDDHLFIIDRLQSHDPARIWTEGDIYRKIPYLTFALNHLWTGEQVWSWHLVNLALHICVSLTIFGFCRTLWRSETLRDHPLGRHAFRIALVSGLVFLCHPLMTSAVTYIYQRMIVMATLFHVLTLYAYARARIDGRLRMWPVALAAATLACFSKQTNLSLPFTLILTEALFCSASVSRFLRRGIWFVPLAALPALLYVKIIRPDLSRISWDMLKNLYPHNINSGIGWTEWFPTQLNAVRTYLRLFVFPIHQTLDYDYPVARSLSEPSVLVSIGLFAALFAAALLLWRRHRLISFGIFFTAVTFLPEFFAIRDILFEHRAYLPFVGFALALPAAVFALTGDARRATAILTALIAAMSLAAFSRNALWADEERFWQEDIRRSPNKGRPYYSLGVYYAHQSRHDLAVPLYRRAIEIWPLYADAWTNLGKSLEELGQTDESVRCYARAVEIDPTLPEGLNNYGSSLVRMGRYEEARKVYLEAIRRRGDNFEAMNNMGSSYAQQQRFDEAMEWYRRSIQTNPAYADSQNNMGSILGMKGDHDAAEKHYREALRLRPAYFEARINLATLYVWKKELDRAAAEYEAALAIRPDHVEANNNLGSILAARGDYEKAEKLYLRAHRVDPRHLDTIANLAILYSKTGRDEEARRYLALAQGLDPRHPAVQRAREKLGV